MDSVNENAYKRKKDPQRIKHLILENTIRLAAEQGVNGISIQNVATMSGITKGGVFHHFANKQALLEAMLEYLMIQFDDEISLSIAKDPVAYGCFTRAYICVTLNSILGINQLWSAMGKSLMTEKIYCEQWNNWLEQRLAQHAETDNFVHLKILRLAADGLWYMENLASVEKSDYEAIQSELLAKTYPENI